MIDRRRPPPPPYPPPRLRPTTRSGDFTGQTLKISLPQWITIPNAGLASSIAVIGTNPVDRAKTIAQARSIHWSPYDRVGVVNAVP